MNNIGLRVSNNSNFFIDDDPPAYDNELNTIYKRIKTLGGINQWKRIREAKLDTLKKALLYSYQSAIVQKYDPSAQLSDDYQFRCLINHDKLKVDYEDKIISIPFEQQPVNGDEIVETGFHNGTIFKWVHGNKEEWTPDTYWIVYMQYSEETAYFRAEIRKADEEIEIITVDSEGEQSSLMYRGWMTGPNETSIVWHTKKNTSWNDLNYTKILYITKDENTLAFFKRFDRVIVNGKPWQIQAYNADYSKGGNSHNSGIIRVALKETYTTTNEFIKQVLQENEQVQKEDLDLNPHITGPTKVKPYSVVTFVAKNFENRQNWVLNSNLARIIEVSQDGTRVTVQIITGRSNKNGFYINYGENEDTKVLVSIESL